MAKPIRALDTKLIHVGEPEPPIGGAVSMPIFQSATFETRRQTGYHDQRYARLSNTPNHEALHAKLSAVENAEAALVTGSGMAAISAALFSLLGAGDHMLAQNCLYGGTHGLLTAELARLGVAVDFVDGNQPASWEPLVRPTTRLFYVETMTNPLLEVGDLEAVTRFCREHGLASVVDNTLASPVNFRPVELGFDLSLHSGTKYLNGHSDIVAGAIIGRAALVARANRTLNHLGGALDPHACFLLHRGMKTLGLRVRQHNQNALEVARFLEASPKVARVNYAGLPSHRQHERARRLFEGFGGLLSFELKGGPAAATRLIEAVSLPYVAPSLGGVESLITRPAATSHAGIPADERRRMGISDGLIRLSVGLEAAEDLIEDLSRALETC
ncbi:MAG: aminotransferase class I/II-fold pyridoxal phosphate-dependent enzyme [Deltaproteobacteria bacterium]|nr:aminotransferase class I/II-fold pyridoxal phosphate-dependent enzyme [Deltaproteobacteria bacterium]